MKTILILAAIVLPGLTANAQVAAVAAPTPTPPTAEQIDLAVQSIYEVFPETQCYDVVLQDDTTTLVHGVDQDGAVLTTVVITEAKLSGPCPPHCD